MKNTATKTNFQNHENWQNIIDDGLHAIKIFTSLPNFDRDPDRYKGGYFGIIDINCPVPDVMVKIGTIEGKERDAKCAAFRLEKALRIIRTGKLTSYATRDPENGKWGGAILFGDKIFTFSGIPEKGDECLCAWIALRHGYATLEQIRETIGKHNEFWEPFYEAISQQ